MDLSNPDLTVSDLSYPIGRFDFRQTVTADQLPGLIDQIACAPENFRAAVAGLDDTQLATPYRPGGWTVRQTIHHVGDSHMNSFLRFRLALTENQPPVKGYDQAAWGELVDSRTAPIEYSLQLIDALHLRWVYMLRRMTTEEFARGFQHSELGIVRLDLITALYAWHGRHHCAHITRLRERNDWK
jgi:hypothetical protein